MPGYRHQGVLVGVNLDLAGILNLDKKNDNGDDFHHLENALQCSNNLSCPLLIEGVLSLKSVECKCDRGEHKFLSFKASALYMFLLIDRCNQKCWDYI